MRAVYAETAAGRLNDESDDIGLLAATPVQGLRRRLSEKRTVSDRELSELPEPLAGGDRSHGCSCCISLQQGLAGQVHPPQPKVADRAHTQTFLAHYAQCALWRANGLADFREVQRRAGLFREKLLETRKHNPMIPIVHLTVISFFIGQAAMIA
jgi:hypothetical protein